MNSAHTIKTISMDSLTEPSATSSNDDQANKPVCLSDDHLHQTGPHVLEMLSSSTMLQTIVARKKPLCIRQKSRHQLVERRLSARRTMCFRNP